MPRLKDFPTLKFSNAADIHVRPVVPQDLPDLTELLAQSFHPPEGRSCGAWFGQSPWYYPLLKFSIQEDLRLRLRQAATNHTPPHTPPDYACWVATANSGANDEIILGTVELSLRSQHTESLLPGFLLHTTHRAPYLSNLAVHPHCRRQGVARQLLEICRQTATQWGQTEIFLHVLENNQAARQLYTSAGYRLQRPDPSWETWLFQQSPRLLLRRVLNPSS